LIKNGLLGNKYTRKAKGTKREKMEEMGTVPEELNR
jgi:hypothetical protein